MSFLRKIKPGGAIADFRTVFREAGPSRWRYAALSALCTFGVFSMMATQSWTKERKPPEVTFINSWPANRTAAETKAFIIENQRKKELREAAEAAAAKEAQKLWMAVGRASGIDVDEIKKKADAEAAAAKAKDAQSASAPAQKAPVAR